MEDATSTFRLLENARCGDRESLSEMFEKHRRRLAVLIHFKAGPRLLERIEVDDLVQETMLRAFKDLDHFTYRSPGSFVRWLSSIADHVIADRARYLSRGQRAGEEVRFRSPSNPMGPEPADSDTPSRVFTRRENLDRLIQRLELLPADYREALLLAKFEELPASEIAERLGKSREAVALLVYRALKRLRALASGTPS